MGKIEETKDTKDTSSSGGIRLFARVDYPPKEAQIKVDAKASFEDLKKAVAAAVDVKLARYTYFTVGYKTDVAELAPAKESDSIADLGVKEGHTILVRAPADIKPIKRRAKKEKEEDKKDEKSSVTVDRYKGLNEKNVLKKFVEQKGKHKLAGEYIDIYASKIVKRPEFAKLPKDILLMIVKSDTLNIKEVDLFDACLAWGKREAKETKLDEKDGLKTALADILPHIRFPCMTTQDVAVKVTQSGLLDSDQILDLFTYLGIKANNKKATPGKSLAKFTHRDRKGRKPPSWFKFDVNKKHSNLTCSSDGTTISSNTTSYYQPIFGDITLSEGSWDYEIVLQQYYNSSYSVCVGYVPSSYTNWSSSQMIGYSGHIPGWSFACANAQKYNSGSMTNYGRTCQQGDVVGVKLDLDKKTLEFSINGTSQGVAFTDVSGPVRPALSLYGTNTVQLRFPK